MDEQTVISQLDEIIEKRLNINFKNHEEWRGCKLLGNPFYAPPRGLLMVLLDIENIFNIKIPQETVLQHQFETYQQIYQVIKYQLNCAHTAQ